MQKCVFDYTGYYMSQKINEEVDPYHQRSATRELIVKEQKFVNLFCSGINCMQSSRLAGYKNLPNPTFYLLHDPSIQREIKKTMASMQEAVIVTYQQKITMLLDVATEDGANKRDVIAAIAELNKMQLDTKSKFFELKLDIKSDGASSSVVQRIDEIVAKGCIKDEQ